MKRAKHEGKLESPPPADELGRSNPAPHEELLRFVGFDEDDEKRLRAAYPIVSISFPEVAHDFYRRIAAHPGAAQVFRDAAQVTRHQSSVRAWLDRVFTGRRDREYFDQTTKIGEVHVDVAVPLRFLPTSMHQLANALEEIVRAQIESPEETIASIRKALSLELAVMMDSGVSVALSRTHQRERARTREHARRLASLATLGAGLAHEIRNPLNGAQLHLTLLKRQLADLAPSSRSAGVMGHADLVDAVEVVGSEIRRLSKLVTDFLSFANPKPLNEAVHDLRDICRRASTALDGAARKAAAEISLDLSPSPVPSVVDRERFEEVLRELIANAVEAGLDRPTHVVVRARTFGEWSVVEVEDDGVGIDDPEAPLFDPFYTTKPNNSGLGLSIAHRVVTESNGTLSFGSRSGKTTFSIRLPRAEMVRRTPARSQSSSKHKRSG